MLKLAAQLIVVLSLWFGLQAFDVSVFWRCAAVLVGMVLVHVVWERFVFQPFLYLGAMPVASDDPIMLAAIAKAREELPVFFNEIYPKRIPDSMVKFTFTNSFGGIENLWGDLLEVVGDRLKVYVRTSPTDPHAVLENPCEIDKSRVVDWQVEYHDGTLRGGYTNKALFKIFERQEGYMHPAFLEQIGRFRELDEPERINSSSH